MRLIERVTESGHQFCTFARWQLGQLPQLLFQQQRACLLSGFTFFRWGVHTKNQSEMLYQFVEHRYSLVAEITVPRVDPKKVLKLQQVALWNQATHMRTCPGQKRRPHALISEFCGANCVKYSVEFFRLEFWKHVLTQRNQARYQTCEL